MVATAALLAGCSSSTHPSTQAIPGSTSTSTSTSASAAGSPSGLLAFLDRQGIEVADPLSGQVRLVVPIPSPVLGKSAEGSYMVNGPVWGAAPGVAHPVIYFALAGAGSVPHYGDVFFRADPFTGQLTVIDAIADVTGQTEGLAWMPGQLLYTAGCCEDIGIDSLPLATSPATPATVESPTGGMWTSMGATWSARLAANHIIISAASTPNRVEYVWVDPADHTTLPLQLPPRFSTTRSSLGALAVDPAGTLEAMGIEDLQASTETLEVFDVTTGSVSLPNSLIGSVAGLAFAPSGPWLAVASAGTVSVIDAAASTGDGAGAASDTTTPSPYHLARVGHGAQDVSWSAPVSGTGFAGVRAVTQSASQLFAQASASLAPSATTTAPPASTTVAPPTTTPPGSATPDLFVSTAVIPPPGELYNWPSYPKVIQIDSDTWIGGGSASASIPWVASPASATASATTWSSSCSPNPGNNCTHSEGPTAVSANQPMRCTVDYFDPSTGTTRASTVLVFDHLQYTPTGGKTVVLADPCP